MKKFAMLIAGIGIAASIPAATAQSGRQSIDQRQTQIERQIDQGVRSGRLTRQEATQLRTEFYQISRLEDRYLRSAPGMTNWERRDLNNRFDALERKIRIERADRGQQRPGQGDANWWNINQRQAILDRRIDQGVRNGQLNRAEAVRLRAEFRAIVGLEARYRRSAPGLTMAERRDLDRRFDVLARKIRWERSDWERRR